MLGPARNVFVIALAVALIPAAASVSGCSSSSDGSLGGDPTNAGSDSGGNGSSGGGVTGTPGDDGADADVAPDPGVDADPGVDVDPGADADLPPIDDAGTGALDTGSLFPPPPPPPADAGMCANLGCFDVGDCAIYHAAQFGPCGFTAVRRVHLQQVRS
jgi:hypothetical protein